VIREVDEVIIKFNLESPQEKQKPISIIVDNKPEEGLLYKYIIGCESTWSILKDFSRDEFAQWLPKKDGNYTIMVQGKRKEGRKAFDYVSKSHYVIGVYSKKLITKVNLIKDKLQLGEKQFITVESSTLPLMYRYKIKEDDKWELLKDYSGENTLTISTKRFGKCEILIECKTLDSKKSCDDFEIVSFQVIEIKALNIIDFKCLTKDVLAYDELLFEVEAEHEDRRMILFKFIKVDSLGKAKCIQDFSSKRIVSFTENVPGEYKLLCHAKDIYSLKEYDDRAIINYVVKPYNNVSIQSFTADVSSPQVCGNPVLLKVMAKGGSNLLYRFIIEGNHGEDSGFIKNNSYEWISKSQGEYKIDFWVKDASYEGNYEAVGKMDFTIDEFSKEPVVISEVIIDKKNKILINETANIKLLASSAYDLRYSFLVIKAGEELEKIEYGTCNWIDFTQGKSGSYQIEARVKTKYSTREFDSHCIIPMDVYEFIPSEIDYILYPIKERYMVGDRVTLNVVAQSISKALFKYILKINDHKVEETKFVHGYKYEFTPKCIGAYTVEVHCKNEASKQHFDSKREVHIDIYDALPITNMKISCEESDYNINETLYFTATSQGGKEVLYEFYVMEQKEWILVQKYGRRNEYSFMPFAPGEYKVLALSKSSYNAFSYEDYDIIEFSVNSSVS